MSTTIQNPSTKQNPHKRQLTHEEKLMAKKGMLRLEEDIAFLSYQVEYHNLMIDVGLQINLTRKLNEFKGKRKEFRDELEIVNKKIEILKDQITSGVNIKPKPTNEINKKEETNNVNTKNTN